MGKFAPIIFMAYKRPELTRKALESLAANPEAAESDLFVFADGPKDNATEQDLQQIAATRQIIRSRDWCGTVHLQEKVKNEGLAKSVINAVTDVLDKYGRAIILEDDLVLAPCFLQYMNEALEMYEEEPMVACIHGYVYPVAERLPDSFFVRGADCWGWATWSRAWKQFEPDGQKLYDAIRLKGETAAFNFDNNYDYMKMLRKQTEGKNDSWAVRWYASAFLKNMVTLYPGTSLVQNIGMDASGTHMSESDAATFDVTLASKPLKLVKQPAVASTEGTQAFIDYFKSIKPGFLQRIRTAFKK